MHVGVEEGLSVGFERVPTISASTDMASGIARTAIVTAGGAVHLGYVEVFYEVIFALHVAAAVGVIPTESCPALGFLGDVPFDAEIDVTRAEALDEQHIHHAFF